MSIEVFEGKCIGCKACVNSCAFGAISMSEGVALIDSDKCVLCGACVDSCKFDAIIMRKSHKEKKDLSSYKGVWVFCEQKKGKVQSIAYELLSKGRELADTLGVELSGVLLGDGVKSVAKDVIARGADKVYVVDTPELKNYEDEPYCKVIIKLIEKYAPEIVLMGATVIGRSLAPRIATKICTGLTADCTSLDIDVDNRMLLQTRPAFGGNIMATILCQDYRPQMATVRHKVFQEAEPDASRKGEIIVEEITDKKTLKSRTTVVNVVEDVVSTINIAEADIIVTAGRGIGKPENLKLVEDLAKSIGAAVGATRAVVDSDWIEYSHQVGQTGKTVCPKIYIACGVSGQIQHLIGMQSSKTIIAINKDPDAPIFKVANYGIVGDVAEVVPELTKCFDKLLGNKK